MECAMHQGLPRAIGIGLAISVLGGCFFTGVINDEPEAKIDRTSSRLVYRGDTIGFSAAKSADSDGDDLTVDWRVRTCLNRNSCDEQPFEELTGVSRSTDLEVEIPPFRPDGSATLLVKVELTVFDGRGAPGRAEEFVDVLNRDPEPLVQVQDLPCPTDDFHPVGSRLVIAVEASDPDGDEMSVGWQVRPPGGSSAPPLIEIKDEEALQDGKRVRTQVNELVPDAVGSWQVEITLRDGVASEPVVVSRAIPVREDCPPCIASTDPLFVPDNAEARYILDRSDGPRRFAVLSVADDLDIYPPPDADDQDRERATFRWFVASPDTAGQRVEVEGRDIPDYTVDASAYSPGDRLTLQVEAHDRAARAQCDSQQPFCDLQGTGCYQRVTWELEVR